MIYSPGDPLHHVGLAPITGRYDLLSMGAQHHIGLAPIIVSCFSFATQRVNAFLNLPGRLVFYMPFRLSCLFFRTRIN